MCDIPLILLWC